MKTLVIGDIHGCHEELLELLDKAGFSTGMELIALGDFVDRGPDTPKVLELLRDTPGARALLGNHERKHLRASRGKLQPALSQVISREQFGESYPDALAFLGTLPLYIELDEALLAHGFFEPGVPLEEQREIILAGVMSGEAYLTRRYGLPWYELYDGSRPIIVAHHHYLGNGEPLVVGERVFGIDTGCVHGSRLPGLLLPEFRLVSVPARANHWARVSGEYRRRQGVKVPHWSEDDLALLEQLVVRIQGEHAQVVSELVADDLLSGLNEREQAKLYAARVEGRASAAWLHSVRKGRLTPDALRRSLHSPEAARALLASLDKSGSA